MSFFFPKKKPSFSARLERQQYLAKFEPTNVVDYSECGLSEIPSGTFVLCNVWLKEVLLLHSNALKTLKEDDSYDSLSKLELLRVLDLHSNQIVELPSEIGFLRNLQVLNLEDNKLHKLCPEIGQLTLLQTLNVRKNKLTELPSKIGMLKSLRTLDISDNRIKYLPITLANAQCLEALVLDEKEMKSPPFNVCNEGTAAIMRFLCAEADIAYVPSSSSVLNILQNPRNTGISTPLSNQSGKASPLLAGLSHSCDNLLLASSTQSNNISTNISQNKDSTTAISHYESLKEQKRLELAKLQQDFLSQCEREALMLAEANFQKAKLLNDLDKQNNALSSQVEKLSEQRKIERIRALDDLKESEESSRKLVERLLIEHETARKREIDLASDQYMRENDENQLKVQLAEYENLRRSEVQSAMENQLRELCAIENLLKLNETRRQDILQNVVRMEMNETENIEKTLRSREQEMKSFIKSSMSDEQLQKQAVLLLMQQKDERIFQINRQLSSLQDELLKLTLMEMQNRDMKDKMIQQQFISQRLDLTTMMDILVKERDNRKGNFKQRMIDLEKQRLDEQADFWLVQYQRLLDMRPESFSALEKFLDDDVKSVLIDAKATIYLPIFAKKNVTLEMLLSNDDVVLQKLGVSDEEMRRKIRDAAKRLYKNRFEKPKPKISPTGSKIQEPQPGPSTSPKSPVVSVQMHYEVECVICSETPSTIVFIPCGHVCCCAKCESLVKNCPMCRQIIDQKLDLSQTTFLL